MLQAASFMLQAARLHIKLTAYGGLQPGSLAHSSQLKAQSL